MESKDRFTSRSIWEDAQLMLEKAEKEGIKTAWDRREEQGKGCKICEAGLSCDNCTMGPCRIFKRPDGTIRTGICGATADVIVARNFGRFVAGGASAHSDHGRDVLETFEMVAKGEAPGYRINDPEKLKRIAEEVGINDLDQKEISEIALELVEKLYSDFGSRRTKTFFSNRAPEKRQKIWADLDITPRGIDREVVEMMHRTHMGVDNDYISLMTHAAKVSLSDGWGGSMIGTELSDIIFGTPSPTTSKVNLGVLKEDSVNVLVHGHNPVVSEMVLAASRDPELIALAKEIGAEGINVVGLCCTGNELLMRQGIPMAGNHLMTELVIVTGAADAVVVDYQCIMPSLVNIASCYHTQFISTSNKGRFTGATHLEITPGNAKEQAIEIVKLAIEAYRNRDPQRVLIPSEPVPLMTGFSNEALLAALGGSLSPLIEAIVAGEIKGVVGVVGCNNPRIKQDSLNVGIMKELIKRDILVLVTGCVTSAAGKAGLLQAEAIQESGPGLNKICGSLGIPPVLHVGSCVDNSRILQLCALIANELGVDISDLPVAASAPEWYSEKAAAIGLYAVASGINTHLGHPPNITGSENVVNLATNVLNDVVGARFLIDGDAIQTVDKLEEIINQKRRGLGLEC
ncbi:MAG: anaerobic carbon-monoxide dehydrogenase catalytic subunit [Saccharofermentanales bacterium]|jgi:carbon-monoxide dehydrogenase catalytic subunit|nr:anaerobic carbon-monoxide dehydrogenase catalytic subunit [Bacillota bacterium]